LQTGEVLQVEKQSGIPLRRNVAEFFDLDDPGVLALLESAGRCLGEGRLRFVVLMDRLDERLKDLILFVNENSRYDIYGVEMEIYKHAGYEILIPRLFGAEVRKSTSTGPVRRRWDEASFLEQARAKLTGEPFEAVRKLLTFSKERCSDMGWGTGPATASFSPKFAEVGPKSVYSVYADGRLVLNFHWLHYSDAAERLANDLSERLQTLPGIDLPEGHMDRHVTIPPEEWGRGADQLTELVETLLAEQTSQ
jgi:hypothetical protein